MSNKNRITDRSDKKMAVLMEYKCPACGGAIEFDSSIQKMKCPFCDTEFAMETLKELEEEIKNEPPETMEWEESAGSEWQEGETDGMKVYVCKSCGGEIIGDENTAATSCLFCGNPVIITNQFAGTLRPDLVIPFKFDKKMAKEKLMKHLKGKRLLPKVFKEENRIDEIKGIYVPFWLFDTDVDADIHYNATKTRSWSDDDYKYMETSYYEISRGGRIGFEQVPVDGSSKMADDLMESIEPFNYTDAVDFQTAYLAGYLADKYDVTAEESIARANKRVKRSTEEAFRKTVRGYANVTTKDSNIRLSNGSSKYALCPVWLLNTTWHEKDYVFAMNGQTGKFVGDLPVDKGAYRRWFAALSVVFGAVIYVILGVTLFT
jgi:DNA-directed RNA polymerase subunit RPC12/RpoP